MTPWYPPAALQGYQPAAGTGGFLADAAPLLSNPPFMYSMTPPDFRALCAELVDELSARPLIPDRELIARSRAALAEPEPEGPSEDDLTQLLFDSFREPIEFICDSEEEAHLMIRSHVKFALAALARLAQRHPQPVPVSERPWEREGWCDGAGKCWWGRSADEYCNHDWHYATRAEVEEFCSDAMPQACLPAHALPVPGEVEG